MQAQQRPRQCSHMEQDTKLVGTWELAASMTYICPPLPLWRLGNRQLCEGCRPGAQDREERECYRPLAPRKDPGLKSRQAQGRHCWFPAGVVIGAHPETHTWLCGRVHPGPEKGAGLRPAE